MSSPLVVSLLAAACLSAARYQLLCASGASPCHNGMCDNAELHQEAHIPQLHQEAHNSNLHQEAHTTELHQEAHNTELRQEAHTADLHQEAHTAELRQEAHIAQLHQGAHIAQLHQEAHPTQLHQEAHPTQLNQEAHPTQLHQEAHPTQLHQEAHIAQLHQEAQNAQLHQGAHVAEPRAAPSSPDSHIAELDPTPPGPPCTSVDPPRTAEDVFPSTSSGPTRSPPHHLHPGASSGPTRSPPHLHPGPEHSTSHHHPGSAQLSPGPPPAAQTVKTTTTEEDVTAPETVKDSTGRETTNDQAATQMQTKAAPRMVAQAQTKAAGDERTNNRVPQGHSVTPDASLRRTDVSLLEVTERELEKKRTHGNAHRTAHGDAHSNARVRSKTRKGSFTSPPPPHTPRPRSSGPPDGASRVLMKGTVSMSSSSSSSLSHTARTDEAVWAAAALGFLLVLLALSVLHTRLYRHWRTTPSLYWRDPQLDYDSVADVIDRRLRVIDSRRKRRTSRSRRRDFVLLPTSSSEDDSQ